jgi:ribonuclease G
MSKELFVSSTPHETKVAVVEDDQLSEIYYERENEYTLAGSIYKGRVTRVLPGMQSAFVNIGLERDAFLYVSDFLLEEEDVEGLDQVVARSRIIESPSQDSPAEERPPESSRPLEADEIMPPIEAIAEHVPAEPRTREVESVEPASESSQGEEQEREGARKWRGRRRRRGGRGRFQNDAREERSGDHERERSADQPGERLAAREEVEQLRPERPVDRSPMEHAPIVLPGESISKYQPRKNKVADAPAQPAPVKTARPSTEYSFESSDFSPDSMVLPGESISKYRGQSRPAPHTVATQEQVIAKPHEAELGVRQDEESAGPVPRGFEHVEEPRLAEEHAPEHEHEEERLPEIHRVQSAAPPAFSAPAVVEHEHVEKTEAVVETGQRRFRDEDTSQADRLDAVEEEIVHEPAGEPEAARPVETSAEKTPAEPQPWKASGSGVVEEEEISEEEETDLPGFQEDADLAEFEELEEEVLGSGSEQMVAFGSELTEAVRDAHINERATGQYEAEGLESREEFDESSIPFAGMEEEDDELEVLEAEGAEDLEGSRAEHRAAAGTAGYQQPQRSERRQGDRGGRRPGRRPMRGRRHYAPRKLPAISDLLKEGQEILVQIAKEPIAKKGARITSHIALPGRFVVYMPTVHHTGVSRKIASEEERHRLKRIALSERGEAQGGFIVRTAAAGAVEEDLRADIRFLINLWNEIRGRAETSKAPALIYHDLNLVERILRDQVTTSFSAIWVDTEHEYERILRFVSRFQPSLLKRVKLYSKETPLFEQFNITDEINKALKSKVWLKSGGYIVINQTEALVAIDVNTGKYVGKTARLEDTIVKTNIDAIREIVRQIRLRDLGGIIVIDFIDMDERKNRHKVMQALEDALKADRAPSKVLQFNDFGLVAITRKRVKQSLERTLGQPCPTCQATGMIKSVGTVCNEIYVEMRKMSRHFERDVMLRVNPEVAKALKAAGGKWIQEMEELTRRTVLVKSDPLLHPESFDIQ